MERDEVGARIETFVRERFDVHPTDGRFDRSTHLFDEGYVDSIGVVELLAFLHETFGVDVPESELTSDLFTTVDGIAQVIARHTDPSTAGHT
jgi:acyl carrier protein